MSADSTLRNVASVRAAGAQPQHAFTQLHASPLSRLDDLSEEPTERRVRRNRGKRHSSVPRSREEDDAAEEPAPLLSPALIVTPPPRSSRVGLGLNTALLYGELSPRHFYRERSPSPPPIYHEEDSSPLPELLPSPRPTLAPAAIILPPVSFAAAPIPVAAVANPLTSHRTLPYDPMDRTNDLIFTGDRKKDGMAAEDFLKAMRRYQRVRSVANDADKLADPSSGGKARRVEKSNVGIVRDGI
ncbi:hypothetical protein B0H13DRAFT_2322739 [Mycena leptocephala]|nr:hypothetical protein B0H13DRAFT_2322739 [Mycena leptocephala]